MTIRRIAGFFRWALLLSFASGVHAQAQDLGALGETKPFEISGSLNVQAQHYATSVGNSTGRPDLTGYLAFSPTITVYGVQFPFSFYLTTSEATFRQPFNEFGVSPRYKWLTGHFGYRTLQFSQYSLSYQRWLGAGVEGNTGGIRFAAMYGRFQKAIDEDTIRRIQSIHRRLGYAIKAGYGNETNYVDLTLFKAWDDSTSLGPVQQYGLRPLPAENAVLAVSTRFGLLGNRLTFDAEFAGSIYTRDLGAPEYIPAGVPSFTQGFMRLTTSSSTTTAARAAIGYGERGYRIALRYERVDPNYNSMGVGYVSGDREDVTIAPAVTLFSTLRLNGSLGLRRNNLLGDRSVTTRRLISSIAGSWQATRDLGFDLRYANYSTSSSDGRIRVTDTTRVENVSRMISGGPRISFGSDAQRHTVTAVVTHQQYDDRSLLTGALNNNRTTSGTLSYGSAINEYSLNASLSHAASHASTYDNTTTNAAAGVSKSFMDHRLSVSLALTYSVSVSPSTRDTQLLPSLSATYQLSDRDVLSMSTQLSQNTRTNNPYTEVISSAGYSRTF
jgi:hypothetical protein